MKNILLILSYFVTTGIIAQSRVVPMFDPIPGAKLTLNSLVAKTPLTITTGGGTDTVQCATCATSGAVPLPAGYIARGTGTTIYADSFFVTDTTKHWVVMNRTTPLGVFQVYPYFSGTVTTTSGNTAVTGTSTLFLSTFQPGDTIQYNSENRIVSSIASNTALTLTANAGSSNTNVAYTNPSTARGVIRMDENGKIYRYNRLFSAASALWGTTSFGLDALQATTTTTSSTAFGYKALTALTTGLGNTAVGFSALAAVTTAASNTAVGYNALALNTGADNAAMGYRALAANTSGINNTAFGSTTLPANQTGSNNTAIGAQSSTLSTGSANTAVGSATLNVNTTGTSNVAIGHQSLNANKTGNSNTAVGTTTMRLLRSGNSNTAFGYNSLDSITTASFNTAIGMQAGTKIANGLADSTGSNSVFVGYDTRAAADGQTNQNVIGNQAVGNGSNTTTLGNTSTVGTYIAGGGLILPYAAKTGTYAILTTDYLINCTSGTFTVTLPTAVGVTGRSYEIVNSGSGTITIATTSSQTFVNINATPTTLTLGAVAAAAIVDYQVTSNGANWIVTKKIKNE